MISNRLGLNDPQSPNYIQNQSERIAKAAELQTLANNLGVTAAELIASFNN